MGRYAERLFPARSPIPVLMVDTVLNSPRSRGPGSSIAIPAAVTWMGLLGILALQIGGAYLSAGSPPAHGIWLGCMWGGLSASVWVLGRAVTHWPALLAILASAAWHALWMHAWSSEPLSRYLFSIGLLVVLQSLVMVGSARLRSAGRKPCVSHASGRYGIASLLVLTLVSAVVFSGWRSYVTDDALYHLGTLTAVTSLVAIATVSQRLVAATPAPLLWAGLLFATAAGGWLGLHRLMRLSDQLRGQSDSMLYAEQTAIVLATFTVVVMTLQWCLEFDAARHRVRDRVSGLSVE